MIAGLKISLCLIAKNEEACIAACIQSAKWLVDEVIVVDTGSSDHTVDIARRLGAQVYPFVWNNHFAAARNTALAHATGDWIVVLDADEMMEPVAADRMEEILTTPGVEGYYLIIRSYLGSGEQTADDWVVRLFKNKQQYRFAGAIHEQIAGTIRSANQGGGLAFADLIISHYGYLESYIAKKQKHIRNIGVIRRALLDNPNDPFLIYSLGIEYIQNGDTGRGNEQMKKALKLLRGDEEYFRNVLLTLSLGLCRMEDWVQLQGVLARALKMMPNDADLHLIRGLAEFAQADYVAAVVDLKWALQENGEIVPLAQVHTLLGDVYNYLGNYAAAENEYISALRLEPEDLYPLTQILGIRQRGRGNSDWNELGMVAASRDLSCRIRPKGKRGNFCLALILSLLGIQGCLDGSPVQGSQLIHLCQSFAGMAERLENCLAAREAADYIQKCAYEMEICAQAMDQQLAADEFYPAQQLRSLVKSSLDILIKAEGPLWLPNPNLYCKKEEKGAEDINC